MLQKLDNSNLAWSEMAHLKANESSLCEIHVKKRQQKLALEQRSELAEVRGSHNGHLSTKGTAHRGRQHHPPACGGHCGQDDLLNLSVIFWNIPIHGAVGVIFLESPNMGRIPQTLKLSHPA